MRNVTPGLGRVLLVLLAAGLWGGSDAHAQACFGSPTLSRQMAVGAGVSFTDGATGYGIGFNANLASPLAVGASVEIVDVDNFSKNVTGVSANLGYELPSSGISACPFTGVSYASFGDTFQGVAVDVSRISFPLGLGIGTRLDLDQNLVLIPSGSVYLQYMRDRASASQGGVSYSETETDTAFGASLGATLGVGSLFGRGAVGFTNEEGSDPVFTITLGIRF